MLKAKSAKSHKKGVADAGASSWPPLSSALEQDLEKVREVAPPPPNDAIYAYLTEVFRLAGKWWKPTNWKEIESEIDEYFTSNFDERFAHERFRFIIEVTAPAHIKAKMKWKYATALRVASEQKIKASEVATFIKDRGGLNQTIGSRKFKKQKSRNKKKHTTSK